MKRLIPAVLTLVLAASSLEAQTARTVGVPAPRSGRTSSPAIAGYALAASAAALSTRLARQPFVFNGRLFQFVPGIGFVPWETFNTGPETLPVPTANSFVPPANTYVPVAPNAGFITSGRFGIRANLFPSQGVAPGTDLLYRFVPGTGFVPVHSAGIQYRSGTERPGAGPTAGMQGTYLFVLGVGFVPAGAIGRGSVHAPRITVTARARDKGAASSRPGTSRSRTSGGLEIRKPASDPDQARLLRRMQRLMESRPLTAGEVVQVGATAVRVRYEVDGRARTGSVPVNDVFFFRSNPRTGRRELATAATLPGELAPGDRTLIPLGTRDEPQQRVAGSRQEIRSPRKIAPGDRSGIEVRITPVRRPGGARLGRSAGGMERSTPRP